MTGWCRTSSSSPLLDHVVTWTEGAEGGSEPSVLAGPWHEASATAGSLRPADPNIETALDEFLVSQLHLRSPATICRYEEVLDLLGDYLDGSAHEQLCAEEHAFFMRHYEAEGAQQRDFCELFGPDKIPPTIDEFLNFFMTSKVMGSGKLKKTASSLCKKLSRWLQEAGRRDHTGVPIWTAPGKGQALIRRRRGRRWSDWWVRVMPKRMPVP